MPDNNQAAQWAAATELMGQGVNAWSAAQTNKKQREWQEMMYSRQRTDALTDWQMQNDYNSPQQQMARLKAAGLNPALIYGSGSATAMSTQAVRSSSPGQWSPKVPEINPQAAITGYFNQKMQEAAIRNMDTKNTVLLADAAKKAGELDKLRIDTMKSTSQIKSTDQMTAQRTTLLPILMEQIKANIERTGGQTQVLHSDKLLKDAEKLKVEMDTAKSEAEKNVILERNKREAAMNSTSIAEMLQRIQNLKMENSKGVEETRKIQQETERLKIDKRIQELELQFRRGGNRPNDPFWYRKLEEIIKDPSPQGGKPRKNPGGTYREGQGQEHSF